MMTTKKFLDIKKDVAKCGVCYRLHRAVKNKTDMRWCATMGKFVSLEEEPCVKFQRED